MMWLPVITCIAVLCTAVFTWRALRIGRRALHDCAVLETLLTKMSIRVLELEAELAELRGQNTALFSRIDRLGLRQSRLETNAGKSGFNEAIAFARHGANARELIDTCGLSQGEARLVQALHGSAVEGDLREVQSETAVNEAH